MVCAKKSVRMVALKLAGAVLAMTLVMASAVEAAGDRFVPPMRLGHEPPSAALIKPVKRPETASKTCRKWRQVAQRLGETHAGAALRHAVVERSCAFAGLDTGADEIWKWPWLGGDVANDLPPLERGAYETWTIRCARVGRGERCALIQRTDVQIGLSPEDILRVTTHFVIDTIGGAERVLWRVSTERAGANWFGAAKRGQRATSRESVQVMLPDKRTTEPFDACSASLCMMEADIRVGAVAAAALIGGRSIVLHFHPTTTVSFDVTVSATGFGNALAELARLKRREEHAIRTPDLGGTVGPGSRP
jgi:hypothetical protein